MAAVWSRLRLMAATTQVVAGPLLPMPQRMLRIVGMVVGAVGATFLMRERQGRMAAERLAAALLETLLRAIDANNAETGGHVRRVARYALILADAADLDLRAQRNVERVALFHDVGKIDEALFDIIHDHNALTPAKREAVRTHPRRGADVLAPLAAFYPELSIGVLSHHERWDGSGYPRSLQADAIPLAARIVAIADTFDAITYRRRYRSARTVAEAVETLMRGRGTQFDPDLVDLFVSPPVLDDVVAVLREDDGPKPRRAPRPASRGDELLPELRFRWRTTTPSPQAPGRAPRRSL
jgi:HD-GYP domain-containing protein (c-di-GMP phosphodiesterase class II)